MSEGCVTRPDVQFKSLLPSSVFPMYLRLAQTQDPQNTVTYSRDDSEPILLTSAVPTHFHSPLSRHTHPWNVPLTTASKQGAAPFLPRVTHDISCWLAFSIVPFLGSEKEMCQI